MQDKHTDKNSPTTFFAVTFLLSAPLYLLNVLAYNEVLGIPSVGALYLGLLTSTPAAAAMILTFNRSGSTGVRQFIAKSLDNRRVRKRRWYFPTLFLGPLIFFVSVYWMYLWLGSFPPAQVPLLALPLVAVFFVVLAAGEELGWMGYAFRPLEARFGTLGGALVLGVLWAIWHLPFFWYLMPNSTGLIAQVLTLVAARVLIVWIFNNISKSVLAAILYHAADNTAFVLLPDIKSILPTGPLVHAALTVAAATVVVLLWRASNLNKYRFGDRT